MDHTQREIKIEYGLRIFCLIFWNSFSWKRFMCALCGSIPSLLVTVDIDEESLRLNTRYICTPNVPYQTLGDRLISLSPIGWSSFKVNTSSWAPIYNDRCLDKACPWMVMERAAFVSLCKSIQETMIISLSEEMQAHNKKPNRTDYVWI